MGMGAGRQQQRQQSMQPQQPAAGMGGKGVGQQPVQQPNLNNALSGLSQPPISGIRPVYNAATGQNLQSGMGGKGVGTKQLDPAMQPYVNNLISSQPTQGQLDALNAAYAYQQGTPTKPATGMNGKGVGGQLPPQAGTLNETLTGLYQPPVGLAGQRAAFDAANPQPVPNPMNDPYAARFGVPGDYVGTPAPVQQPVQATSGMRGKGGRAQPQQSSQANQARLIRAQQQAQRQQAQLKAQQPAPTANQGIASLPVSAPAQTQQVTDAQIRQRVDKLFDEQLQRRLQWQPGQAPLNQLTYVDMYEQVKKEMQQPGSVPANDYTMPYVPGAYSMPTVPGAYSMPRSTTSTIPGSVPANDYTMPYVPGAYSMPYDPYAYSMPRSTTSTIPGSVPANDYTMPYVPGAYSMPLF
jgi:hypothetical protein